MLLLRASFEKSESRERTEAVSGSRESVVLREGVRFDEWECLRRPVVVSLSLSEKRVKEKWDWDWVCWRSIMAFVPGFFWSVIEETSSIWNLSSVLLCGAKIGFRLTFSLAYDVGCGAVGITRVA
jgi:hypothetical protein